MLNIQILNHLFHSKERQMQLMNLLFFKKHKHFPFLLSNLNKMVAFFLDQNSIFFSFLFLFPFPFSRNEEYESEITIKKTKKKKKKKGIYFTSSLEYSMRYSDSKKIDPKTQIKDLSKREYVLICAVVPGNVLPVVDLSLYGKPVQDGYQAHYVIGTFYYYYILLLLLLFIYLFIF